MSVWMTHACASAGGKILQFVQHNGDSISSGNVSTLSTVFLSRQKPAAPQASVREWIQTPLHLPACCGRVEVKGLTHHLSLLSFRDGDVRNDDDADDSGVWPRD